MSPRAPSDSGSSGQRRWAFRPGPGAPRAPGAAVALLVAAGLLMAASFLFPYWRVELKSTAHPEGLQLAAYLGHFEGAPAGAGRQQLEHSQQVAAATGLLLLALAAVFAHHRWAALLGLPAIVFPVAVIGDLAGFLPQALCLLGERELGCAGTAVPLWGRLEIGGQILVTRPACGLALAAIAASMVAAGLCQALATRRPSSP